MGSQTKILIQKKVNLTLEAQIVLLNDDYNTFDWVIECLQKYCNHTEVQAEQCAYIVHTKGKCQVKNGPAHILNPICQALCEAGLSAIIK
jgi:ATP-dependent Clp protease adaptor protein ClpS